MLALALLPLADEKSLKTRDFFSSALGVFL
jgi:hypothetical protein